MGGSFLDYLYAYSPYCSLNMVRTKENLFCNQDLLQLTITFSIFMISTLTYYEKIIISLPAGVGGEGD